jgi:hypothetical protein
MLTNRRWLLLLALAGCLGASPLRAQATVGPGRDDAVFRGFVLDEASGEPIQAVVIVQDEAGSEVGRTFSEVNGSYEVPARGSPRIIVAVAPTYRREARSVSWTPDMAQVRVDLLLRPDVELDPSGPLCAIVGSIRDQNHGDPLWQAEVSVDIPGRSHETVLSRPDGSFVLLNVPAGLQRFVARHIAYYDEAREIVVECSGASRVPSVTFLLREQSLYIR